MGLPMNMYTAAGWINVLMGILNLALFLPWSFKEHKIAAREAMRDQGKASGNLDHLFILAAADAPVPRSGAAREVQKPLGRRRSGLFISQPYALYLPSFCRRKGNVEIHETGLPGLLDPNMRLLCPGLQLCAPGNVRIKFALFCFKFRILLTVIIPA